MPASLPRRALRLLVGCLLPAGVIVVSAQSGPPSSDSAAGPFAAITAVVEDAIAHHDLPGAVVLIGRRDRVLYRKAFGRRALLPVPEPMTEDTVFDLASLTKVVATTTSVMELVESGRVRLADPLAKFLPLFDGEDKRRITIRQLLTHTSGFAPDLELTTEFQGADEAIRRAAGLPLASPPAARFIYSDLNFFLLGAVIEEIAGERLDRYAARHVFEPLGMRDTTFLPPASLRSRIAPTERCLPLAWPCGQADAPWLRGIVHDPTARRMNGVAGHAGLFSTADDLSRFCRMLLAGGRLDNRRVLSPATITLMTTPATSSETDAIYGLGWDIDSPYSSNRGDLFPRGTSFGHTGFTGTSLWIDPRSGGYVVFLSNRVHPDGKGNVTALRGRVATIAAAALSVGDSAGGSSPVATGIDELAAGRMALLKGLRVGLLTNQAGRSANGTSSVDLLATAPDVRLMALFSPEHGLRGDLDDRIESGRDARTGLPVYSLYGQRLRPTPAMLAGLDALVVDLPDVGARFYTYATTMAYAMEEAARAHVKVFVLDRPNPIGGIMVEGPVQDSAPAFNGYLRMPIRHGATMGELARLFNDRAHIGADLTVVPMRGWDRHDWFDETGLTWINPSPNLRSLTAAALYPGIGAIEGTNISVGRGTDTPFEVVGAPWMDGSALAATLNARGLAGLRVYPIEFTPAPGAKLGGERCRGISLIVTHRDALRPVRVGLEIASALSRLYGQRFRLEDAATLFGSRETLARIRAGEDPATIVESWAADERAWRSLLDAYRLY